MLLEASYDPGRGLLARQSRTQVTLVPVVEGLQPTTTRAFTLDVGRLYLGYAHDWKYRTGPRVQVIAGDLPLAPQVRLLDASNRFDAQGWTDGSLDGVQIAVSGGANADAFDVAVQPLDTEDAPFVVDWTLAQAEAGQDGRVLTVPDFGASANVRYQVLVRARRGGLIGPASAVDVGRDARAPVLRSLDVQARALEAEPVAPSPLASAYGEGATVGGLVNTAAFFSRPGPRVADPDQDAGLRAAASLTLSGTDASGIVRVDWVASDLADPDDAFARGPLESRVFDAPHASGEFTIETDGYRAGEARYLHVIALDAFDLPSAPLTVDLPETSQDVTPPTAPRVALRALPNQRAAVYLVAPALDAESRIAGYQWAAGSSPGASDLRAWPQSGSDFTLESAALPQVGAVVSDLRQLPRAEFGVPSPSGPLHLSVRAVTDAGLASRSVSARIDGSLDDIAPGAPRVRAASQTGDLANQSQIALSSSSARIEVEVSAGEQPTLDFAVAPRGESSRVAWQPIPDEALPGEGGTWRATLTIPDAMQPGGAFDLLVRARTKPTLGGPVTRVPVVVDAQAPTVTLSDASLGVVLPPAESAQAMPLGDLGLVEGQENRLGFYTTPPEAALPPLPEETGAKVVGTFRLSARDEQSGLASLAYRTAADGEDTRSTWPISIRAIRRVSRSPSRCARPVPRRLSVRSACVRRTESASRPWSPATR